MKVTLAKADAVGAKADLLAVPVFAGAELGPGAEEAVAALGVPVAPLLEARGFTGKAGEAAALATLGRLPATVLLLVGVGERAGSTPRCSAGPRPRWCARAAGPARPSPP